MTDEVVLGAKTRQPANAHIRVNKTEVDPFEWVTLEGKNFTGFLQRGNPGVAILIDGKPLTGAALNKRGRFKVKFRMPPFEPGRHILDIFGILLEIFIKTPTGELITQEQLKSLVRRDFKLESSCHLLFSDKRYRAIHINRLKRYLLQSVVSKKIYVAEYFDCDNFARSLASQLDWDYYPKGYAIGELWVRTANGGHAINCCCVLEDDKLKMVAIEPQSNQILAMPDDWTVFMIKI